MWEILAKIFVCFMNGLKERKKNCWSVDQWRDAMEMVSMTKLFRIDYVKVNLDCFEGWEWKLSNLWENLNA